MTGIIVLIGVAILLFKVKGEYAADYSKDDSEQKTEEIRETIAFPYKLEEEEVEIEALFQYSGMNPDCKDKEGEDIGAVQFKNCSEKYLEEANLTLKIEDGTSLHFQIQDLPSGSSTMAFELSNTSYDDTKAVWEVTAAVNYSEQASLQEDIFALNSKGSTVEVTNTTDESYDHIRVVYRCVMDDMYFGGKSYSKEIDSLKEKGTMEVDTSECYFGEAAVVNLMID